MWELRRGVNRCTECNGAAHALPAITYARTKTTEMTTPRKPKNLREICGTNLYALSCSLVRNECNGRYATISKKSVS